MTARPTGRRGYSLTLRRNGVGYGRTPCPGAAVAAFDRHVRLQITLDFDQPVSALPQGFVAAATAAATYLESQFYDAVSLDFHIGYGEAGGNAITGTTLAETYFTHQHVGYAALRGALAADVSSPDDAAALASLPVSDLTLGGGVLLTGAQAQALGLSTAPAQAWIGVSQLVSLDFDPSDGVAAGAYDLFDVFVHEMTHAMGRVLVGGGVRGGGIRAPSASWTCSTTPMWGPKAC